MKSPSVSNLPKNPPSTKLSAVDREPLKADFEEIQPAIACRAYELFEARGREHGHDLEDWLQAEAELQARSAKSAASIAAQAA